MHRPFQTFIGIDLGGSKGKSTALVEISAVPGATRDPKDRCQVERVYLRNPEGLPWSDQSILEFAQTRRDAVFAVAAPLKAPVCISCTRDCPGQQNCPEPATQWLEQKADQLIKLAEQDLNRIAAVPAGNTARSRMPHSATQTLRFVPYVHRCTDVVSHFDRGLLPREHLSHSTGVIAHRGVHLCKALSALGFTLNTSLLEVSARGTIAALFGQKVARRYKKDADPWVTRAAVLEGLANDVSFAPTSRMAKEEVLANDHGFDAWVAGVTAFLWARDGWTIPPGMCVDDGFVWLPPTS